jgi:hypothetical protein
MESGARSSATSFAVVSPSAATTFNALTITPSESIAFHVFESTAAAFFHSPFPDLALKALCLCCEAAAAGSTPFAALLLSFSESWQPAWTSNFSKQEMQKLQSVAAMLLDCFGNVLQTIFAIPRAVF